MAVTELPRDKHIRRSGDDYTQAALRLLPQGQAWPRAPDSTLARTVDGLSQYYGHVDSRAADLLERESDPRKTSEVTLPVGFPTYEQNDGLLPDWERAWGLPDPCFPSAQTQEQRRRMLVLYMTWQGYATIDGHLVDWRNSSQSRAYFTWLMKFIGFEVKDGYVGEFAPFMCGVSQVGDTRPTKLDGNGVTIVDTEKLFRWYIGPAEQRFCWYVNIGSRSYNWFRAGSGQAGVDPHLRIGVPEEMQCLLNRWKPAHTALVVNFSDSGTSDPMAGTP
jgi:uncharacterized protein YmfQ (DUF2313 family)